MFRSVTTFCVVSANIKWPFNGLLEAQFADAPGRAKVLSGDFCLVLARRPDVTINKEQWKRVVQPGIEIKMLMLLLHVTWNGLDCPRPTCNGRPSVETSLKKIITWSNSNLGRFTGGKSLGGSQVPQTESQAQDSVDVDMDDERPELRREESETTKAHNKTSSQRLLERINMLKQQNEAPKRVSQNILTAHTAQTQSFASSQQSQPKEVLQTSQAESVSEETQPMYPILPAAEPEKFNHEDDDDDWISPIRTAAPAPTRPPLGKSHSADPRSKPAPVAVKPISVSNPAELSTVAESTTPTGSPTGKKHMDGHLSASKAKFYSALRAAKEKIIGSSTTSAQVKLDALGESPTRPKLQAHSSSDDVFSSSPKRSEKTGPSIFSHLRSPSKESIKSYKSKTAVPGSPTKENARRTRSSSEREKVKEKEQRQKQRAEDKLRDMREKEQSKAAAQYQKSKATSSKTPAPTSSSQSLKQAAPPAATKTPVASQQTQPRPGMVRTNTAPRAQEGDSAEDMPPPPPPKSFLPTTGHKLREPKKLTKNSSKPEPAKNKPPQKIRVNLGTSRYGPGPATSKPEPVAAAPVAAPKAAPPPPRAVPVSRPATAASNRAPSALGKPVAASKPTAGYTKSAPRAARPQPAKATERPLEKPKAPAAAQPRSDLASARPVERMQTVGQTIVAGVNRINVPPVNTAKPPVKRPFQAENNDEGLLRPAKRPSQQAKMIPATPAHAHFGKGKIPFAESSQPSQQPQMQFPNGDDIELPPCLDSDDDSDAEANPFEQPSWVDTPNLRELLTQQQLVDPEAVFGPIAPLNMEQMFPDRDRHKKFRQRTSSAYWANDQVTEEEKRKEREARERLVKDGAWTYNPSPRPTPRPGM